MGPARGDYQVAVLSNEVPRSGLDVATMAHYDDDRAVPLVKEQAYPHSGSGIVLWHFGNPWPAIGNHPPTDNDDDPHELPRRRDPHNDQMVHFFRTGQIIDVCNAMPCWPDRKPWAGNRGRGSELSPPGLVPAFAASPWLGRRPVARCGLDVACRRRPNSPANQTAKFDIAERWGTARSLAGRLALGDGCVGAAGDQRGSAGP